MVSMRQIGKILTQLALCLIVGRVWLDTNHNGVFDESDRLMSNVPIGLVDKTGTVKVIEDTDSNGLFSFDVAGGAYRLRAWSISTYCYFPDTGNTWGDTYWIDVPPAHEYDLRMVCFGDPNLPNRIVFPIFFNN